MKHELIKKTLVYRTLAIATGLVLPILLIGDVKIGLQMGISTEITTMVIYYLFELSWRRYVNGHKYRLPVEIFISNDDKHGWYNVIEDLGDNKFVIEVA